MSHLLRKPPKLSEKATEEFKKNKKQKEQKQEKEKRESGENRI